MKEVFEFRTKYGMTQKELAHYLGVSPLVINHWENEKKKISERNLKKFLEFKSSYESGNLELVERKHDQLIKLREVNKILEKDARLLEMVHSMLKTYKAY